MVWLFAGEVSHLRGKVRESGADRKSERKLEEVLATDVAELTA